ncbi:hypothetical protein RFI02_05645 [Acinetobacter sichuanensis]|uniref:hypothetical protein n=1 Tax=Acinetobacter sichuanensis TaxID=2136183 RepID=UPI00280FB696|nr:hypothetical protein [Acinetobacter sichuanensis]MDQ9020587.1 hypothetical protein [Acinetobacter sichuanensis]
MKSIKILSFATAILATSSIYAETKTPPPYGDNPNIFKVLAHKTGEKVQNTAERVGAAAERGVEKIKPKVDNAWEETKTFSEQQTERAKIGVQKGAEKVTETANNTRDAIVGTNKGTVPIERGHLSQSATTTIVTPQITPTTSNHSSVTNPATTPTTTQISAETAVTIDPTQQHLNEPVEPEVSKLSLPIPQSNKNKEDIPQ